MPAERPEDALAAVLKRIDRTSADSLIQSIAGEFVRLQNANAALEARLAAMESLNALADRLLSDTPTPQPVYSSRVDIDAASAFLDAVGFHALELDPKGAAFRWSGPQRQFSFHLFVDRSRPAAFVLSFDGLYAESPVETLRGFVDGEEIALSFGRAGDVIEARGEAPSRSEGGGTTLTFLVPRLASPGDRGLNDRRQLGLSFRRLVIAPAKTV
jgi:hypothetical protein